MSLAIQNKQLILRSVHGSGNNNQKTFTVNWDTILSTAFRQYIVYTQFISRTGNFSGVSAEVRWSLTANNQTDTRGTGQTLAFPSIRQDVDLSGSLVGSFLSYDLDQSQRLFINTPTSTTLTISVFGMDGNLLSGMTDWVLSCVFEPVTRK